MTRIVVYPAAYEPCWCSIIQTVFKEEPEIVHLPEQIEKRAKEDSTSLAFCDAVEGSGLYGVTLEVDREAGAVGFADTVYRLAGKPMATCGMRKALQAQLRVRRSSWNTKRILVTEENAWSDLVKEQALEVQVYSESLKDFHPDVLVDTRYRRPHHSLDLPFDLNQFPTLKEAFDFAPYPLRSPLMSACAARQMDCFGGLWLRVRMAYEAKTDLTGEPLDEAQLEKDYHAILLSLFNLVLIGMPTSGKTAFGQCLAEKMNRLFVDTDHLIEEDTQTTIPTIFKEQGEATFRALEKETIRAVSLSFGDIVSTGGGVIKDPENILNLKKNGLLIFLDRPVELLHGDSYRPLSPDDESVRRLYHERYALYKGYADVRVENSLPEDELSTLADQLLAQLGYRKEEA